MNKNKFKDIVRFIWERDTEFILKLFFTIRMSDRNSSELIKVKPFYLKIIEGFLSEIQKEEMNNLVNQKIVVRKARKQKIESLQVVLSITPENFDQHISNFSNEISKVKNCDEYYLIRSIGDDPFFVINKLMGIQEKPHVFKSELLLMIVLYFNYFIKPMTIQFFPKKNQS